MPNDVKLQLMTDPAALDRGEVVRVALQLLDELGLDGLTMRRLAQRLGVTAASLYWHVRDKDELLSLLAETITAEVPVADPGRPWRDELWRLALGGRVSDQPSWPRSATC